MDFSLGQRKVLANQWTFIQSEQVETLGGSCLLWVARLIASCSEKSSTPVLQMKTTTGFKRLFLAVAAVVTAWPAMAQLNFSDPAINGTYTGIAVDAPPALPANRPSYFMSLTVGSNRQFTASLRGALGNASFRGTMTTAGAFTGNVNLGGSPTDVSLTMALEGGYYVINGTTSRAAVTLSTFKLLRSPYSNSNPCPGAGRYTFSAQAPAGPPASQIPGDLIGTATIGTNGAATVRGYLPDGTPFTCGTRVNNVNIVPVQAASGAPVRTITGSLTINPLVLPAFSDLTGSLRVVRPATIVSGIFNPGYDEVRTATGSLYLPPAFQQLAATWFTLGGFNTVFALTGGALDATQLIANWMPNGALSSPYYTDYGFTGSTNNGTGEVWGSYNIKVNRNLGNLVNNNAASFRAVILQKQNQVRGFYLSPVGTGVATLAPNVGGLEPDYTIVGPTSKSVSGFGLTYSVSVITQGDWVVEIPAEADWVTTDLAGGTDNNTVLVTVARNESNIPRSATIMIAETPHFIYQAARTTSISPVSKKISAAGGSYDVAVDTIGEISTEPAANSAWISATADNTTRLVRITVAANTSTTARTGTINIAGRIHTVYQAGVSIKISASRSPYIPANGGTYSFNVTADGPWTISVPVNEISIAINGVAQTVTVTTPLPYVFNGTGNAVVTVTVAQYATANTFPVQRSAVLTIGTQKHTVTQDWKYKFTF